MEIGRLEVESETEPSLALDLLDMSGRSARPPRRVFYVTWGRTRLRNGRLYRDAGWSRNRVKIASESTLFVRIYEAHVKWKDVTAMYQDVINDTEIAGMLKWGAAREAWLN